MGYFDKEMINAFTNPNGLSGHTSPDGTPLTNVEYFKEKNSRSNDFH